MRLNSIQVSQVNPWIMRLMTAARAPLLMFLYFTALNFTVRYFTVLSGILAVQYELLNISLFQ